MIIWERGRFIIKKNKINIILITFIFALLIILGILLYFNKEKEKDILSLKKEINDISKKEILIAQYSKDLEKIETLKQEIFGQDNKIEELKEQVSNFANSIVENNKKIDELEGA